MAVELIKVGRRIVYASRRIKKTATQQAFLEPIADAFRRLDAHILEVCISIDFDIHSINV